MDALKRFALTLTIVLLSPAGFGNAEAGTPDHSGRYVLFAENTQARLLDVARGLEMEHALCTDFPVGASRDLDRLIGVFEQPSGMVQALWHRKMETAECFRFSAMRSDTPVPVAVSRDNTERAVVATPAPLVRRAIRPTPSGRVLPREHVTSKNPNNGVIGYLLSATDLRRGFQVFNEPAGRLIVDGNGDTVLNSRGHLVCTWAGDTGIPCPDLLLDVPGAVPALVYIESKTVAGETWHLVRFGRYAGWVPAVEVGQPTTLGAQFAALGSTSQTSSR